MHTLQTSALTALAIAMLCVSNFAASTMRCGPYVIATGDYAYEVLRKCGLPSAIEGDRWIYDRGSRGSLEVIDMTNERVNAMKTEKR